MYVFKKICVLFFLLFMLISLGYGAFPHGCEVRGYAFNNPHLVVNENGEQSFYLMQNHDADKVQIERFETKDVFMSPSLSVTLDPMNWAAFASDVSNLHFQCFKLHDNNVAKVNCQDVLEVCQYPRVKFALSNMGNYWVSVNKSQREVINDAALKGILLRW